MADFLNANIAVAQPDADGNYEWMSVRAGQPSSFGSGSGTIAVTMNGDLNMNGNNIIGTLPVPAIAPVITNILGSIAATTQVELVSYVDRNVYHFSFLVQGNLTTAGSNELSFSFPSGILNLPVTGATMVPVVVQSGVNIPNTQYMLNYYIGTADTENITITVEYNAPLVAVPGRVLATGMIAIAI